MSKISVIIPTFNRFKSLLRSIQSVKTQTYDNIEIIVVNDCSTEQDYYSYDFKDVQIIHLKENSKQKFGFACAGGYQRNIGIDIASGDYISFLDDDDIWFPNKLELQINAMLKTNCEMSCTDGLHGCGIYDDQKVYPKYNAEKHLNTIRNKFIKAGSSLMDHGYPDTWTLDFLRVHNCCIVSSVVITRNLFDKVGDFVIKNRAEDYNYWLRALHHTDCVYVKDICMYYDDWRAGGKLY